MILKRRGWINTFVVSVLSVALASCGGSASSSVTTYGTKNAIIRNLQVASDEFAFGNFGASSTQETFGAPDLIAMFGPTVCKNGIVSPCTVVAQADAWAQMVNQSRISGHCEGIVVEAESRFNANASPKTATLSNSGDTTHAIFRAFASQFLPSVQKSADGWARKNMKQKVAALETAFANGQLQYSMGVYSKEGGHSVLPWSIEHTDASHVKIHVYDSNWPKQDRWITADLDKDTWSFPFSGSDPASDPSAWTGKSGDMDMTDISVRTAPDQPFKKGAGQITGDFLVIKSKSLTWSVETPSGTLSPTHTATDSGWVRPLRTLNNGGSREYVVNTTETHLTIHTPDAASAFAVNNQAIVHITTPGSTKPMIITDNVVTSTDPTAHVDIASGDTSVTAVANKPVVLDSATALPTTTVGLASTTTTKSTTTTIIQKSSGTTAVGTTVTTPAVASLQVAITPQIHNNTVMGPVPVRMLDTNGAQISTGTSTITASMSSTGASLTGTTSVQASGGMASFNNLMVTGTPGTSYTITFSVAGGVSATMTFTLL